MNGGTQDFNFLVTDSEQNALLTMVVSVSNRMKKMVTCVYELLKGVKKRYLVKLL